MGTDTNLACTNPLILPQPFSQLEACVKKCVPDATACRIVGVRNKLRKLILELEIVRNGTPPLRCIGKVDRRTNRSESFEVLSALRKAGLRPPSLCTVVEPLGYNRQYGLLLLEKAPGRPLADFLSNGVSGERQAVGRAAAALATLHASGVAGGRRLEKVRADLARFCRELAEVLPDQRTRLRELLQASLEKLQPGVGGSPVPSHGDFHPKNVFLDDHRVTLIDMDTFGHQEPAADVGYFLIQAAIRGYFHYGSFEVSADDRREFLAAYQQIDGLVPEERLALYQGIGLLQSLHYELCVLHVARRNIVETWLSNSETGVQKGEIRLRETQR